MMKDNRDTEDLLLFQCISVYEINSIQSLPISVSPVLASPPSRTFFHFTVRYMTENRLRRLRRVGSQVSQISHLQE